MSSIPPGSYAREYQAFKRATSEFVDECEVIRRIFPLVVGDSTSYCQVRSYFRCLVDSPVPVMDVSPELCDGAEPGQLDKRIRTKLAYSITPMSGQEAPVLSNFSAQFIGPDTELHIAERDAYSAGAFGARGIYKLRSFPLSDPKIFYDDNAYTITAIYREKILKFYAHCPLAPSRCGGPMESQMTPIGSFDIGKA